MGKSTQFAGDACADLLAQGGVKSQDLKSEMWNSGAGHKGRFSIAKKLARGD